MDELVEVRERERKKPYERVMECYQDWRPFHTGQNDSGIFNDYDMYYMRNIEHWIIGISEFNTLGFIASMLHCQFDLIDKFSIEDTS